MPNTKGAYKPGTEKQKKPPAHEIKKKKEGMQPSQKTQ